MDIPLFSGSLLQNQCQGKWRLNLEKASKSLTVIVVNFSLGPGSFIYCKSLHLPELLTSKSFYCRPLRASLMCFSVCFNINIPHMCPNLYRKPWKGKLHARFGRFLDHGYVVNQDERELMRDDINAFLKIIFSFHMCNHPNPLLRFTNFHASQNWKSERIKLNDCRWGIKGDTRFFPGPICSPVWASLKVSFKTVICLRVLEGCDHVGGSSPGPGHTWNGFVCTCGPLHLHPKQIQKTHVNTGLKSTLTWPLPPAFITRTWADRRKCLDMWGNWPQGRKTDQI